MSSIRLARYSPRVPESVDQIAQLEREITTEMRRVARQRERLKDLEATRDDAIRRALDVGVPRRRLVEITRFSPQRIDQIRRRSRV